VFQPWRANLTPVDTRAEEVSVASQVAESASEFASIEQLESKKIIIPLSNLVPKMLAINNL